MTAPTFIASSETASWAWEFGSAQSASPALSIESGDILVAIMSIHDVEDVPNISNSGAALTWTSQADLDANPYTEVAVWTAVGDSTRSLTVSMQRTGTEGHRWGGIVYQFRGGNGLGNVATAQASDAAPTVNITTTGADSAIVVLCSDREASDGASRAWRTNAGALTEEAYSVNATFQTVYSGYHASAGTAGTYAVGLTAPNSQDYSIVAIEVLGVGAPPAVAPTHPLRSDNYF